MSVIIGSARHDENGKYANGQAGDQLQTINAFGFDMTGEVSTQNFYVHSKGWTILRAKDTNLANGLAFCMAIACVNGNIGYDQNNRLGVINKGILTEERTECDCSSLVRACLKQCGHDPGNFTTANEVSALMKTGLFSQVLFSSESGLCQGDILVTKTKGHTVIVVANAKNRAAATANPYTEPTENLKKGSTGDGVKWVQWELNQSGASLEEDGIFGNLTRQAVLAFQNAHRAECEWVDGVVGEKTRASLKAN